MKGQRIMETLWVVRFDPSISSPPGAPPARETVLALEVAKNVTELLVERLLNLLADRLADRGCKLLVTCLDQPGCWSGHNLRADPDSV